MNILKKKIIYFILIYLPILLVAKPIVSSKIIYYDINPKSKQDLKRVLFSKTPILIEGKKYLGVTKWKINSKYKVNNKKKSCHIINLKTNLNVKLIMPRLSKSNSFSYSIKSSFKSFYNKLYVHEKKHKEYAIQAVKEIDKKLNKLPSYKTCKILKERIKSSSQKIINKYIKKNKQYDERTNHGLNRGADINKYI